MMHPLRYSLWIPLLLFVIEALVQIPLTMLSKQIVGQ